MNSNEQRIAIAEACGCEIDYWPDGSGRFSVVKNNTYIDLPDYLNDLNAMHEAEKVLTDEEYWDYSVKLETLYATSGSPKNVIVDERKIISSTAAQRAEAFLRTLGRWEDGE